ncbi:MAG: DnaD domain protein [Chloroflexota bacterium]
MKHFSGFPRRMQFTPVPDLFLSALLPEIKDIHELRVTLHLMKALYHKRGYPRFVSRSEMLGDTSLRRGLGSQDASALDTALEQATQRGTFLQVKVTRDGTDEEVYLLNTEEGRETVAKVASGELALPGLKVAPPVEVSPEEPPDIFTLYEDNIGMLTPLIAEELKSALQTYPEDWLREAIKEAVALNKRSWRYIARILERWSVEGKDGTHQGHTEKKSTPDKYFTGRYGHMVRH